MRLIQGPAPVATAAAAAVMFLVPAPAAVPVAVPPLRAVPPVGAAPDLVDGPVPVVGPVYVVGPVPVVGPVAGPSTAGAGVGYRWPVDGPRVVRAFDPPARPWLAGHRGVDVAADPGAVVRAAGPGVILYAGRIAGRGVVSVRHPGGLRTTYEPLDIDARLHPGDPVTAATPLGTLAPGHRGCPADACLHWGLRRGEQYLDPLSLLGLGRVRLLPL